MSLGILTLKVLDLKMRFVMKVQIVIFMRITLDGVIVTSNNAWFVPSIEPILQKILCKYYARLHNSTILHATNLSKAPLSHLEIKC